MYDLIIEELKKCDSATLRAIYYVIVRINNERNTNSTNTRNKR